jgi:DNA-binding IclR family transcriptional regulator
MFLSRNSSSLFPDIFKNIFKTILNTFFRCFRAGFRILKTLCAEGMADKRGKLYFAGNGFVQIGLNSLHSLEIRRLAIPYLNDLATQTDYTAHLAVPSGRRSLILEVQDSSHPVQVASRSATPLVRIARHL